MRNRALTGALLFGILALAACGSENPVQPSTPGEGGSDRPPTAELAVASNTWLIKANMPIRRIHTAIATVPNSKGQSVVYVIGGWSSSGYPTANVMAYNVAANTWTYRHPLPLPLYMSNGAGVINGKIYVSGGYSTRDNFNSPRRTLYRYDPITNTWTRKSDSPILSDGRRGGAEGVTGVINGKLYVLSTCFRPSDGGYLVSCKPLFFRYNPVSDVWATLPAPFANDTVYAPYAGGVIGGKFYVMAIRADQTGEPGSQGQVFAVYDPGTNQWTKRTPLGRARYGVATAVLGGKLYVMGGDRWNDIMYDYETLDITIVYDPAMDAWTRRASMPSSRINMAGTTVLLNGQPRIEVIGGPAPGNNLQYIP